MAKKIKDTDYLALSACIRAMETQLVTKERMEQVLAARTDEEACKLLQECGYRDLDLSTPEAMDASLLAARQEMLESLSGSVPDEHFLNIFKLKYDYHNLKALLKARPSGVDVTHILMDLGRVSALQLREAVENGGTDQLPPMLAAAAEAGREVLDTTRDGQLMDMALDRWYYREMRQIADEAGSDFLRGYVRTQIDAVNLRALVRTLRMGKNTDFLRQVLIEGGSISPEELFNVSAQGGSGFAELCASTPFAAAAESGAEALKGGALTEFEKRCDDAVGAYLSDAKFVPFGEQPLVAYLAARESEYTNLRILLLGRSMGLAPEVIRSRLRESCI